MIAIPSPASALSRGRDGSRSAVLEENLPSSVAATAPIRKVALLGNHAPRRCGIATFTTDLADAIADDPAALDSFVLAMNDAGERYAYPPRVRFEISEGDIASYRRAADFLNVNGVDIVCVQHEYGIFGGKAGSYLLVLLRELRMPIVTTLHTILSEPHQSQRTTIEELIRLSERLVVMSAEGATLLRDVHGVPMSKIAVIPHGIPILPAGGGNKDRLGLGGRPVILTFGLLSPDKGIEYVIDALPSILETHPKAVYLVVGATHPHVKERTGESYRLMLAQRARRLGVDANMIFHDRFVSQGELMEFLAAADIYVTPYVKPEQITSGTLAYAVGCGKAVVSTPYRYANELLAEGRGVLVPWRDPPAIAREITALLADDAKRVALGKRAALHGRDMVWPVVAHRYVQTFEQASTEHAARRRSSFQTRTLANRRSELPEINFEHLRNMTDDTGLLQHAAFSIPRYDEGYCLDDNARALMLMALVEDARDDEVRAIRALASRYLAFVRHAFDRERGRFKNFMSYGREWTEPFGSEDSHGRAVWALGTVIGRSTDPGRQSLSGDLFHAALPAVADFTSPRAWSFALLGIDEYLRAYGGDSSIQSAGRILAERLLDRFRRACDPEWPWPEDAVTYCNAKLPHALIVSGGWMGHPEMTATGLRALEWLATIQHSSNGYFSPVGSNGFYSRNGEKARFDQQPVEAYAMVSACLEAGRVTEEARWAERARCAFDWFLGQNELRLCLYDATTGGCRDGLHADRLNENEGAESTLSFLLALTEMRSADRLIATAEHARELAI